MSLPETEGDDRHMQLKLTARHDTLTEATRQYAEAKLSKLERRLHDLTLIEAYLRTGRRGDAEELFQQMLETAGPTGLLPEQYDPFAERGLGNHPQAYSHLGLIRCAAVLSAAGAGS